MLLAWITEPYFASTIVSLNWQVQQVGYFAIHVWTTSKLCQGHTLNPCHRSCQQMKICHISVTYLDKKTSNGPTLTFTGKLLVPSFLCFKVNVTPWVNVIGHVIHRKLKYAISQNLILVYWPRGNYPVKPNPIQCHHVYLGWDSSYVFQVEAIGPTKTIVELLTFLPHKKPVP